jgi:tRNA(Ile)-lysidine synthetase-like protein
VDHHEHASLEGLSRQLLEGHRSLPEAWRAAPLGLCLSGGADSCALALAAAQAFRTEPNEFPGGIVAYHARHALRGSASDGDAASVRELCGRLGIALTEVDALVVAGPGLEARARQTRYRSIRDAAGPGVLLATAHHRDDQTETVVMRILRGAGPVGLRGIHVLRPDGIWRPFLETARADLEAACTQAGWIPRQDASNLDTSFARNELRHRTLPVLESEHPGLSRKLAALAESAQRLEPFLERALERLAASVQMRRDDRGFSCDLSGLDDPSRDPELELLLEQAWTKFGRRPWAREQRVRLLEDAASGAAGRRDGGQGEIAIWGGKRLRVEKR